jgi:hypothetical protein
MLYRQEPRRNSSGSFATFAAIRRASSRVRSLAAERRPGSSQKSAPSAVRTWGCSQFVASKRQASKLGGQGVSGDGVAARSWPHYVKRIHTLAATK